MTFWPYYLKIKIDLLLIQGYAIFGGVRASKKLIFFNPKSAINHRVQRSACRQTGKYINNKKKENKISNYSPLRPQR